MLSSTYLIAACKVGRGTTALREFNGLLLLLFSAESVPADDEAIVASHKVLFCATIYWRGGRASGAAHPVSPSLLFCPLIFVRSVPFPSENVSGFRRASLLFRPRRRPPPRLDLNLGAVSTN